MIRVVTRTHVGLIVLSLVLSLAAIAFLLDSYCTQVYYGPSTSSACVSLVEMNGSSVYVSLAPPLVIVVVALVFAHRSVVVAVGAFVLVAYCILAGMSIGVFFLPAAAALLAAAAAAHSGAAERPRDPVGGAMKEHSL